MSRDEGASVLDEIVLQGSQVEPEHACNKSRKLELCPKQQEPPRLQEVLGRTEGHIQLASDKAMSFRLCMDRLRCKEL